MTLSLQNAEQSPDGGIAWRRRKGDEDFGSGTVAFGVEDIHDLAFAAAEMLFGVHVSAKILA
jgi:hypothetical protein